MRSIKRIVVHCTNTPTDAKLSAILKYWEEKKGWDMPGYHVIINGKGEAIQLADIDLVVNGARGYNANSIHIAYIGRFPNEIQLKVLREEIDFWKSKYKDIPIMGHKDLPGVSKTCPNFNVIDWYYHGSMPKQNTY